MITTVSCRQLSATVLMLLSPVPTSLAGNCVKSSVATIEAVRCQGRSEEKILDFTAILVIICP